jgi:PAT family beta-lactamase induction signal transducer AmpG
MIGIATVIAFCSASQDMMINAYQVEILESDERGMGSAMYVFGYRIALLLASAAALILASHIGFQYTYRIMALCMLPAILATLIAPKLKQKNKNLTNKSLVQTFIEPIKELTQRYTKSCLLLLLISIILYKLGDAFTLSLSTTFLLRYLHFSMTDLALANKTLGLIATIFGGLAGGVLLNRMRLYPALILCGILQAVSNLGFMLLAYIGHNYNVMVLVISIEAFFSGMGTCAFMALLMKITQKEFAASQFAIFTALSSLGRVYIGPIAAVWVLHIGWTMFYFYCFIIGLPVLLTLRMCKNILNSSTQKTNPNYELKNA